MKDPKTEIFVLDQNVFSAARCRSCKTSHFAVDVFDVFSVASLKQTSSSFLTHLRRCTIS